MKVDDRIPNVDVRAAAERLASPDPPLLVDVREPNEFEAVRIVGAVLMPLSTFAVRFPELPRDRALVLQCAVGGRSGVATAQLIASGYRDVTNLTGGIVAWERAGLPVKRGRLGPGEGDLPG